MAARWCGKKDWGEARPSPYWVESYPAVPCVALASVFMRRITGRERAPVDSVASRCTMLPAPLPVRHGSGPGWRRRGLSPCGGRAADQWVCLVPSCQERRRAATRACCQTRRSCRRWWRRPRRSAASRCPRRPRIGRACSTSTHRGRAGGGPSRYISGMWPSLRCACRGVASALELGVPSPLSPRRTSYLIYLSVTRRVLFRSFPPPPLPRGAQHVPGCVREHRGGCTRSFGSGLLHASSSQGAALERRRLRRPPAASALDRHAASRWRRRVG
jgi:hypothetical protein